MDWKAFIERQDNIHADSFLETELLEIYGVYSESINSSKECSCFIARDDKSKFLIVTGGESFGRFEGEIIDISGSKVKKCPLSNKNSIIIRRVFDFTNPVTVGDRPASIGLGDRLGVASSGHIKLVKGKNVFPILAQQSIRELNLTGRTYEDVLSAAVWAVLQEGYRDGYGADGDHLKTAKEVRMALECGFTMITLDCSEYIQNDIGNFTEARIGGGYSQQTYWENKYLDKSFKIGDSTITVNENELAETVRIYGAAIDFAVGIYHDIISQWDKPVDFEISIDETLSATDVKAHYIIASELYDRGAIVKNVAPRFCGEFQKGIDYKGDIVKFEQELVVHNAIANHFGYRLSIHSGSDKFSVFPLIGEKTNGKFHIKTAGTNWLEALRVIALEDAGLFREMYRHSIKRLDDAKAYYHIFTDKSMVPDEKTYQDYQLDGLLTLEESRQALHITYGFLLGDMNDEGGYLFRDRFFKVLHQFEDTYDTCIKKHIGRHLTSLGI